MWLFRAIISLVGATLPLLFLSGSYSPIGSYLPNLLNLFGKQSSLGNLLGIQATPVLPIGAAGLTGFATKEITRNLSMEKNQVEKETNALKTNGYLTGNNKLTSKGLETLS